MQTNGGTLANTDAGEATFNGASVNNNLQFYTMDELDNLCSVMVEVIVQYSREIEDDLKGRFTPISNDLPTAHFSRSVAMRILTKAKNERRRRYATMLVH